MCGRVEIDSSSYFVVIIALLRITASVLSLFEEISLGFLPCVCTPLSLSLGRRNPASKWCNPVEFGTGNVGGGDL